MEAEEIARWFKKYGYLDVSYEHILCFVRQHLEFGTIEVIRDKNDIIGVVRYNIEGETAQILDCVVREDKRNKRVLKLMVLRGVKKWPQIRYIQYERGLRDLRIRRFDVMRFLNLREEVLV